MGILEEQIQKEIENAISNIVIQIKWDSTNDLEVSLVYNDQEISSDYIDLDEVYARNEYE